MSLTYFGFDIIRLSIKSIPRPPTSLYRPLLFPYMMIDDRFLSRLREAMIYKAAGYEFGLYLRELAICVYLSLYQSSITSACRHI